jgi:imidazolonepropionase-like amidohydrolase
MMTSTEDLVRGSIDMHMHHGPDAHMKRSVDALQAAVQAEKAGMRAIVLKHHDYPTAPLAEMAGQSVPNVKVFGSICLDFAVGGLNPSAVEISALLGAKVVWMPTFSAAAEMEKRGRKGEGISIMDELGQIKPAVREILQIIKSHDMVLATGHLGKTEAFALVGEARRQGITKMVMTHATDKRFGANLSIKEQREIAEKGAFVEHCFVSTLATTGKTEPESIVEAVKAVGANRCILSTDLGQAMNPPPAEGMSLMVGSMLNHGLTAEEIETMIKVNPAMLLGLT